MNNITITVFTAVFNRAHTMNRLYKSLQAQTSFDFEWLIVDDGSTDGLCAIVEEWINEKNNFQISYYYVKNGGKHRAINVGAELAIGELFYVVDSDDYISEDAIEFLIDEYRKVYDNPQFAGVSGLKASYEDGRLLCGNKRFVGCVDATCAEARNIYGMEGDKAEAIRTSLYRKYPFPVYEGENFMGEGAFFSQLDKEGLMLRWNDKVIYYAEYLPDGLSVNMWDKLNKNPLGYAYVLRLENEKNHYFDFGLMYRYYLMFNKSFSRNQMITLLGASEEQYFEILKMHEQAKQKFADCLLRYESFALYGYGKYGRLTEILLDDIGLFPRFIVDKNATNIKDKKIFELEGLAYEAECVLVAIKSKKDVISSEIKKHFINANIIWISDIYDKIWL